MVIEGKGNVYLGLSGWSNPKFYELLYPRSIRPSDMLEYYSRYYSTVEINSSFYRIPAPHWLQRWHDVTPKGFLFSFKANRKLTHIDRLVCDQQIVNETVQAALLLKEKLGPILFQLPASAKVDRPLLEKFLSMLPHGLHYAVEIRRPGSEAVGLIRALDQYKVAYCVNDFHDEGILRVTADFAYVRLHGPVKPYEGSYTDDELEKWADAIEEWVFNGRDVYVYFNNTKFGEAIGDSRRLAEILSRRSLFMPLKELRIPPEAEYGLRSPYPY